MGRNLSIGTELHPHMTTAAILGLPALDHLQISVPSVLRYTKILNEHSLPVIFHSHVFNPFSNKWENEIDRAIKNLEVHSPVMYVEHLTCPRLNDKKLTVRSPHLSKEERQKVFKNTKRYNDLVNGRLSIENVPVTSSVQEYFELLAEVSVRTKCSVTIDYSHLLMSLSRLKDVSQVEKIVQQMPVNHIHLSGISLSDGKILDDHERFSSTLAAAALKLFRLAKFVTIEQGQGCTLQRLLSWINVVKNLNQSTNDKPSQLTFTGYEACENLTNTQVKDFYTQNCNLGESCSIKNNTLFNYGPFSELAVMNKYFPSLYPVESFLTSQKLRTDEEGIRAAVSILKLSSYYGELLLPKSKKQSAILAIKNRNTHSRAYYKWEEGKAYKIAGTQNLGLLFKRSWQYTEVEFYEEKK